MEEKYRLIHQMASPYLNTRKNDIHVAVVLRYARLLIGPEGGEEAIVIPAVLLHDVGWSRVPEDLQLKAFGPRPGFDRNINRIHEVEGAKIAREILSQVDYDPDYIEKITAIVEGHDSRLQALSINDAIVKDADKLFRYSKEGFAIDCERFALNHPQHRIFLSERIEEWFFTDTGKELAREELEALKIKLAREGRG